MRGFFCLLVWGYEMKRVFPVTLAVMIMAVGAGRVHAQSADAPAIRISDVIVNNNLHRIGGYTTMVLLAATVTAGALEWDVHPILGYSTLGAATITASMGFIAYRGMLRFVWPHALFNTIGFTGLFLNAFVLEPGSTEHRISAAVAASSFGLGYISIILLTR
ncbi:MAG: hypothetical protein EA426_05945 [Spirochaetaceae bacterium]|nr:MAG: hypothetical protein EA426_05945 [Spirochaetaceae bacterium]